MRLNSIVLNSNNRGKNSIEHFCFLLIVLTTTFILSNCTPRVIPGPVYFYPKAEPVEIEMRSFSFYPDHIAILKEQLPFTFRSKNTASIKHNVTLIDSRNKVLIDVNLMPGESTTITIEPLEPGNYVFYCNRFLHRRKGMAGMLMVRPIKASLGKDDEISEL